LALYDLNPITSVHFKWKPLAKACGFL